MASKRKITVDAAPLYELVATWKARAERLREADKTCPYSGAETLAIAYETRIKELLALLPPLDTTSAPATGEREPDGAAAEVA